MRAHSSGAREGEVLLTTTTGTRGEWSFTNITAGDYVVRAVINGQVAGIRVSATPGQLAFHQRPLSADVLMGSRNGCPCFVRLQSP